MAAHASNYVDGMHVPRLEPMDVDDTSDGELDPEPDPIFNDVLVHLILPKQTPGQQQDSLEHINQFLLETFTKSIKGILTEVPIPQLKSTEQMLEKWVTLQPTTSNFAHFLVDFPNKVKNLKEGETIPIYVRCQNSTLLIRKSMDKSISLSTFRPSLPSEIVMSNVLGAHFMNIPETIETIQNSDLLKSQSFAKQLHKLATEDVDISYEKPLNHGNKYIDIRDVADPKLVSDWIVGLLVPGQATPGTSDMLKGSQFQKKFRDQVSFTKEKVSRDVLPFRRSGMYMALKGTVQLKLSENLDSHIQAKLVYKIIMLRILANIGSRLLVNDSTSTDIATQLLAKLGRRVEKLVKSYNEMVSVPEVQLPDFLVTMKDLCLQKVSSTVKRLTERMKSTWDELSHYPNHSQITYQHDDKDLYHQIPNLDNFIEKLKTTLSTSSPSTNQDISRITESEIFPRCTKAETILALGNDPSLSTASSLYVWLYDTENFVKYHCNNDNTTSDQLTQILLLYFANAKSYYGDDPLGKSQIYLVSLKGLEILDKVNTKEYPLLLEYKPEVNTDLFDYLLLPFKRDLDLLDNLLLYFKNRMDKAELSGLLSSNSLKNNSFPVRYAKKCRPMIDLHQKITNETDIAIQQKKVEVQEKKVICEGLLLKLHDLKDDPCACRDDWQPETRKRSRIQCNNCKLKYELQEQLEFSSKSVYRYQKPLPNDITMQWAIIFELMIPQKFASFRDYLAHVKYVIWGDQIFNGKSNDKYTLWAQNTGIASYKSSNADHPKNIQLSCPWVSSSSQDAPIGQLNVLNNQPEDYIINSSLGCIYYCTIIQDKRKRSIEYDCSFQLNSTHKHERYSSSNLQITLESTNHTQNSILARQVECHQELGLDEFLTFGSLRAGHRIQLRNLYAALISGSLSLERESVLALILQTIWQTGPRNEESNERESHVDFFGKDTQFADEFLDMLNKLVMTNTNYSNSLTVLAAVIITRRIADLNKSLQDKCYGQLKRWITLMFTWITKIETALNKPEVASAHGGLTSLRKNLLEIVICSMVSYSVVSEEDLSTVIKEEDDVVFWMDALFHWNRFEDQPVESSQFFKILQGFVKTVPLRLNLQNQILAENNLMVNPLKTFISKKWNKTRQCTFSTMDTPYQSRNKGSLVLVKYLETDHQRGEQLTHQITFDFIRGRFLINGFCQSSLPLAIKDHKLFRMYFKDATNLKILRENDRFARTVAPIYGRHYEFHQTGDTVIIREVQEDDVHPVKLVLLDPDLFSGVLSNYFRKKYTHWLDINEACVYFREHTTLDDHSYKYTLKQKVSNQKKLWTLFDEKTQSNVLSIDSSGFKHMTRALKRLELEDNINVTFHKGSSTTTATLRRYNLRFSISPQSGSCLKCVEYPDYHVSSSQQSLGTLIGLSQGLLLENDEKRLILVPHSTINYSGGRYHQNCEIQLSKDLRQPPCFVYEVDDVLKRLKAHNSKSAWLYLAALHAVTSSPFFPDPFTEVTGTEMAMHILHSACVWSCFPYDTECLTTLNFIKTLSPKRKWYHYDNTTMKYIEDKGSMEITQWPQGLPSMVSYDGYAIIVDKLTEESEKLAMLHDNCEPTHLPIETTEKLSERLRLRGYLRSLPAYNSAAVVEYPGYFGRFPFTLTHQSVKTYSLTFRSSFEELHNSNMQLISNAFLIKSMKKLKETSWFGKNNLSTFLITKHPLKDAAPLISLEHLGGVQDLLKLDLHYNWSRLYTMATLCTTPEDYHLYGIILSAVAYRGESLEQLANLHCISLFSSHNAVGNFPAVPSYFTSNSEESTYYECPENNDYQVPTVANILARNAKPFTALSIPQAPTQPSTYNHYGISSTEFQDLHSKYKTDREKYETDSREYQTQKAAFEHQITTSCSTLSNHFKRFWPCEQFCDPSIFNQLENHNFNSALVVPEINKRLEIWYRNHIFTLFVAEVQAKLNYIWDYLDTLDTATRICFSIALKRASTAVKEESKTFEVENAAKALEGFLDKTKATKLEECDKIFQGGCLENTCDVANFQLQRKLYKDEAQLISDNLIQMLKGTVSSKILYETGVVPRLSPIFILKHLATIDRQTGDSNIVFSYSGALGVLWTHLKRLNRCIRTQTPSDLQKEKDNPGHENWSPKEHPKWLLLELELDIIIRPIQVEVANQMIQMPNGSNGVTQLNMGEGKTSVIVPMLCTTLAQRNSQLCRVTVLSSMFKMNLNSLTFSIGGLLNKRVYSVPCRRDMKIDEECVNKIYEAYRDCLDKEGVVLTLPEYRLSFRLLAYDNMYKKEWSLAEKMMDVENFMRKYARDVLDESDELFSVKYQLVYTIGEQVPTDGGDLRWLTCQKILDIIPEVGETLFKKYGPGMVEFHENLQKKSPHQFSTFRLLGNDDCLKDFQNLVAESLLSQMWIPAKHKQVVKRFLTEDQVNKVDHEDVMTKVFSKDSPDRLDRILLYSGYLRRGVLGLALTKRWRVEYGVNPKPNPSRLMAIPFRAKDVTAEKTEFGHPDLAIILTYLSYYYSGLSNKQLQDVFDILKIRKSPYTIYSQWIKVIPKVPDFLANYYNLNMKDVEQKTTLFDILRRHKMVINFWLCHCVFPRESKQFPGKLVMTAWDLCCERQRFPVTGFSGTNDSKELLPIMITQQDLKQLEKTNEDMTKTLLQPENGMNHKGFPMGVTCQQILETMKQDNLTVLIDAGALMLECSNEQVADLWLKTDSNVKAAVYFNENNELLVKTRDEKNGQGTPFEVSPYQARLEKCGVFLDDQHTRGTDLKFPFGSKACVTVATRMKRDKLIQACMRMRKLGQGHSVTFYLSHEARDKIKEDSITTQGVLKWVCANTTESNKDGLVYWAIAGRNYAQRLAAEDHFHFPCDKAPFERSWEDRSEMEIKMKVLADQCVDDEVVKLVDLYGQASKMEYLSQLVQNWFDFAKWKLRQNEGESRINPYILRNLDKTGDKIADKNLEMVPDRMSLSTKSGSPMEEEQEKELEAEQEEERNIERPRGADPAVHRVHENVRKLVIQGEEIHQDGKSFVKNCNVFENTTFWNEVEPQSWKGSVFATKDFVSTIKTNFHTDTYLRPVQFLISNKLSSSPQVQWLAISPFEANELLPYFRSARNTKCTLHMFSARSSDKQDLLLNNHRLQLPPATDNVVLDPGPELTLLLLTSGNLYFASIGEQHEFTAYLGLFPQPWSQKEKLAFEQGKISKSGFLSPEFRSPDQQLGFQKDPTSLVKKILLCRHSFLSDATHLVQLLNEQKYVVI